MEKIPCQARPVRLHLTEHPNRRSCRICRATFASRRQQCPQQKLPNLPELLPLLSGLPSPQPARHFPRTAAMLARMLRCGESICSLMLSLSCLCPDTPRQWCELMRALAMKCFSTSKTNHRAPRLARHSFPRRPVPCPLQHPPATGMLVACVVGAIKRSWFIAVP